MGDIVNNIAFIKPESKDEHFFDVANESKSGKDKAYSSFEKPFQMQYSEKMTEVINKSLMKVIPDITTHADIKCEKKLHSTDLDKRYADGRSLDVALKLVAEVADELVRRYEHENVGARHRLNDVRNSNLVERRTNTNISKFIIANARLMLNADRATIGRTVKL